MSLANDIAQHIWLNAPLQHRNYQSAKEFIDPVTKLVQAELDKYIVLPLKVGEHTDAIAE